MKLFEVGQYVAYSDKISTGAGRVETLDRYSQPTTIRMVYMATEYKLYHVLESDCGMLLSLDSIPDNRRKRVTPVHETSLHYLWDRQLNEGMIERERIKGELQPQYEQYVKDIIIDWTHFGQFNNFKGILMQRKVDYRKKDAEGFPEITLMSIYINDLKQLMDILYDCKNFLYIDNTNVKIIGNTDFTLNKGDVIYDGKLKDLCCVNKDLFLSNIQNTVFKNYVGVSIDVCNSLLK